MLVYVVPLVKNWGIHIDANNTTGTRTYATSSLGNIVCAVPLPSIFDSWSNDWPMLRATNMEISYLNDDSNCGLQYLVSYSSLPYNDFSTTDYVQSIEVNSDSFVYNDNLEVKDSAGYTYAGREDVHALSGRDHWLWSDGTIAQGMPMRAREVLIGYNISRDMYYTSLTDYLKIVMEKIGKINIDIFQGIPKGLALFLGADISQSSLYGDPKWNVKLSWSIKNINGTWTADDGWQKIFRPIKNIWEVVVNTNGDKIYQETTMTELVSSFATRPVFPGI